MKELDYGTDYKYAHAFSGNFVDQEYMPDQLRGVKLYEPGKNAAEEKMRQSLKERWKGKYGY